MGNTAPTLVFPPGGKVFRLAKLELFESSKMAVRVYRESGAPQVQYPMGPELNGKRRHSQRPIRTGHIETQHVFIYKRTHTCLSRLFFTIFSMANDFYFSVDINFSDFYSICFGQVSYRYLCVHLFLFFGEGGAFLILFFTTDDDPIFNGLRYVGGYIYIYFFRGEGTLLITDRDPRFSEHLSEGVGGQVPSS